jgi:hypothetical protein
MPFALCRLTVTRQPAADIGILFSMTLNTFTHAPVFIRQSLKILHLSVAFLTGDFVVNMALVIEKNVFGYVIDFYPRRGGFGVKISMFL